MTMRAKPFMTAVFLLGTASCTMVTTATPPDRDAARRMDLGLEAMTAGAYRAAFDELSWVYTHCAGHERGVQALVGLAALELDARNEVGRPQVGSELLARLITQPGTPEWLRPLTEASYLMAAALGAVPSAAAPIGRPDSAGPDSVPAASRDIPSDPDADSRAEASRPVRYTAVDDGPVHNCGPTVDADDWVTPDLPVLPGPSLVALLAEAEASRDAS
ncbi:MAG TPA: hypothetical protein VK966_05910, partial [Longimicrobiales bacterium]|nr:hypothetical protein [Longimicrobiales bacterium]